MVKLDEINMWVSLFCFRSIYLYLQISTEWRISLSCRHLVSSRSGLPYVLLAGNKVADLYKVWSVKGCQCIWSGYKMPFNIRERGTSYCLIRSPVSTIVARYRMICLVHIKLLQWQFQVFLGVSLFEKLICKSRGPQHKQSKEGQ